MWASGRGRGVVNLRVSAGQVVGGGKMYKESAWKAENFSGAQGILKEKQIRGRRVLVYNLKRNQTG